MNNSTSSRCLNLVNLVNILKTYCDILPERKKKILKRLGDKSLSDLEKILKMPIYGCIPDGIASDLIRHLHIATNNIKSPLIVWNITPKEAVMA